MMNCRKVKYCLPDYVRDQSSEAEATIVRDHLATCEKCRREAEELSALLSGLSRQSVPPPSYSYWNSLLPRIHERLDARRSERMLPESIRLLLPSSVALMLIVVALNVRPMKTVVESQDIHALVHQLAAEELNQVAQQDEVEEAYQASVVLAVPVDILPSDKEVVKAFLLEGETFDFPYELDPEFTVGSVSEDVADEIVNKLEHEQAVN